MFLIAAAVIFIALLNLNWTYKSQTDVLIIPRSATAVQNSDQILDNLATLPSSLSFYDKMTADDPAVIEAGTKSLPEAKKKAYWDSKINVERLPGSGVLEVTATDDSMSQAEIFSGQAAKELIATAGFYYNIQTDIDVRIIDGPITREAGVNPEYVIFFESLAGSFLLVTFAFFISFFLFGEKENFAFPRPVRWTFTGEKTFSPLRKEEGGVKLEPALKNQPKSAQEEKAVPVEKEAYSVVTKKAAAPANLPIAEDVPVFSVPASKDNKPVVASEKKGGGVLPEEKKETAEPEKKEPIIREATPEEVKERLNKLLSGKL